MQESFPVTIIVTFQTTRDNRWQTGHWKVSGLVAGGQAVAAGLQREILHLGSQDEQHLWKGLRVRLHKDDAESYYFNIVSETPKVFVVCHRDAGEPLQPFVVTLSYDEAASYMEGEETVEAVNMPPELYRWVEQYVLEHYVPEKRKKRKRDSWKETQGERSARH